ncbi:hypothetical protein Acy02nite_85340 [Actinoplanes cyaneus]|uniref:Uncharacterized protein n=1 Tax=Actinoplanes cyaneus TaxID=52696 RepID=A0A919ISJ7_9ACTN|nr:hypothetical protein [Actinoplanes cyaneus]GID70653.1 hypothetical protein Acy02nite_85340 [Actinoplanes cyaneus]
MATGESGYEYKMTMSDERSSRSRTEAAMHDTADKLEVVEAAMHRSAQAIPDQAIRRRLHDVANQVTATAIDIEKRAEDLPPSRPEQAVPRPARG